MKTVLSSNGYFTISGPDKTKRLENPKKNEKLEIFMQSIQANNPSLYEFAIAVNEECFSNINHLGLDLEVESIIIHLTTSNGDKYDFDISVSTSLEGIQYQILDQFNI